MGVRVKGAGVAVLLLAMLATIMLGRAALCLLSGILLWLWLEA